MLEHGRGELSVIGALCARSRRRRALRTATAAVPLHWRGGSFAIWALLSILHCAAKRRYVAATATSAARAPETKRNLAEVEVAMSVRSLVLRKRALCSTPKMSWW
jgi:hypothetical protein